MPVARSGETRRGPLPGANDARGLAQPAGRIELAGLRRPDSLSAATFVRPNGRNLRPAATSFGRRKLLAEADEPVTGPEATRIGPDVERHFALLQRLKQLREIPELICPHS
jgi:hypothetical protein